MTPERGSRIQGKPHLSAKKQSRGASGVKAHLNNLLASYARHHSATVHASLARLAATPVQSLLTMLVIAIALALPTSLHTLVDNLRQLGGEVEFSARMTVFLRHDVSPDETDQLLATLNAMEGVDELVFVSRDEALTEFSKTSGFGDVLGLLDENPLPPVVLLKPVAELGSDPQGVTTLIKAIAGQPQVDDVAIDLAWLQRLQGLLEVGRKLAWALGVALGLGVLLIMGNTIRLAIENRREEIVVVKLIGGTNGYLRRPFLYTGLWYGAGGGFMAWLLVWLGVMVLGGTARELAGLYQSGFSPTGPGFGGLFLLLLSGGLLGLLGAWIAVAQYARQIEPE